MYFKDKMKTFKTGMTSRYCSCKIILPSLEVNKIKIAFFLLVKQIHN